MATTNSMLQDFMSNFIEQHSSRKEKKMIITLEQDHAKTHCNDTLQHARMIHCRTARSRRHMHKHHSREKSEKHYHSENTVGDQEKLNYDSDDSLCSVSSCSSHSSSTSFSRWSTNSINNISVEELNGRNFDSDIHISTYSHSHDCSPKKPQRRQYDSSTSSSSTSYFSPCAAHLKKPNHSPTSMAFPKLSKFGMVVAPQL